MCLYEKAKSLVIKIKHNFSGGTQLLSVRRKNGGTERKKGNFCAKARRDEEFPICEVLHFNYD